MGEILNVKESQGNELESQHDMGYPLQYLTLVHMRLFEFICARVVAT